MKDNAVLFAIHEFERTLEYIETHPEYSHLKGKVRAEYNRVRELEKTGNLYDYYKKFRDEENPHRDEFAFLSTIGIKTSEEMADYIEANYQTEINNRFELSDFVQGETYTNNFISMIFLCSYQGGMRKSNKKNALVLLAVHNNPLYSDEWKSDGTLHYTGMGTIGDQSLTFMQNKTLLESQTNGVELYLFESYSDNEYIYTGRVELAAAPYISYRLEPDTSGNLRRVAKFPLRIANGGSITPIDVNVILANSKKKEKKAHQMSDDELAEQARRAGNNESTERPVTTVHRDRNELVSEHTKRRAAGLCDLCSEYAPFNSKNGNPYLEEHHVLPLADGGPDAIYNTVALCPNCHRKMHVVHAKADVKLLQRKIRQYLENINDNENIQKLDEILVR